MWDVILEDQEIGSEVSLQLLWGSISNHNITRAGMPLFHTPHQMLRQPSSFLFFHVYNFTPEFNNSGVLQSLAVKKLPFLQVPRLVATYQDQRTLWGKRKLSSKLVFKRGIQSWRDDSEILAENLRYTATIHICRLQSACT